MNNPKKPIRSDFSIKIRKLRKDLSRHLVYIDLTNKNFLTHVSHPTRKEISTEEITLTIESTKAHLSNLSRKVSHRYYRDLLKFNEDLGNIIVVRKSPQQTCV